MHVSNWDEQQVQQVRAGQVQLILVQMAQLACLDDTHTTTHEDAEQHIVFAARSCHLRHLIQRKKSTTWHHEVMAY